MKKTKRQRKSRKTIAKNSPIVKIEHGMKYGWVIRESDSTALLNFNTTELVQDRDETEIYRMPNLREEIVDFIYDPMILGRANAETE